MNTYCANMRPLRRLLPAATSLLLLASCGSGGATNSGGRATLDLSPSEAGGTFTVHVHQAIQLTLTDSSPAPGASTTWTAVSSNPAVVVRTAIRESTPTSFVNVTYPVVIDFVARSTGIADIVGKSQAECEALVSSMCHGPPAMTFHIRVVRG